MELDRPTRDFVKDFSVSAAVMGGVLGLGVPSLSLSQVFVGAVFAGIGAAGGRSLGGNAGYLVAWEVTDLILNEHSATAQRINQSCFNMGSFAGQVAGFFTGAAIGIVATPDVVYAQGVTSSIQEEAKTPSSTIEVVHNGNRFTFA